MNRTEEHEREVDSKREKPGKRTEITAVVSPASGGTIWSRLTIINNNNNNSSLSLL